MQYYSQYIIQGLACPACGEENEVQFDHAYDVLEAPCSSCEVLIRWRRRTSVRAHGAPDGLDDPMSEVAVPSRGAEEVDD